MLDLFNNLSIMLEEKYESNDRQISDLDGVLPETIIENFSALKFSSKNSF